MNRLLAAALTLSALVLSGCGTYQSAVAPDAVRMMGATQQRVQVETRFLQVVAKTNRALQAGERLEVMANVAYQAPDAKGTLRVYFEDAQGRPVHDGFRMKLQGRQGATTAWVDAVVPPATQSLTLRATVEYEKKETVGALASQRFAVKYTTTTVRRREMDMFF